MLLSNNIENIINETMMLFFIEISKKYKNIKIEELVKDWKTFNVETTEVKEITEIKESSEDNEDVKLTESYLSKCLKPELKKLCKDRNLKYSGTKSELIKSIKVLEET